jgi:hypothetical protein
LRAAVDVLGNAHVNVLGLVLNRSAKQPEGYGYYVTSVPSKSADAHATIGTTA